MRFETIQEEREDQFKRLVGVRKETFDLMLRTIHGQRREFGRPPKLGLADQLLMTLLYWREYRTLFHLSRDFDISEATASRTVRKVEDLLIRSKAFRLPGKKSLRSREEAYEVVIVDATESPIERWLT